MINKPYFGLCADIVAIIANSAFVLANQGPKSPTRRATFENGGI